MHPPLASRPTLCAALTALVLLAACSPGGGGGAPASPDTAASAPGDSVLARDLQRIERAARARPEQYERELRSRGAGLPAGSAELLDILALRGQLAALARNRELCDQIAASLRAWPAPDLRANAAVAAASVSAEYLRAHGDLREARKLVTTVDGVQLSSAGVVYRWRHYRLLASISSDVGELDAALTEGHQALRLAEQTGQSWRVALTLAELAFTTYRADTPARARQITAQALAEAQKDPDPMTLNQVYTMRGIVHADDSDSSIALQANSDALEQAALAGADSVRALGLANFADHHLRQARYSRALELAEQALPLALATRNTGAESVARSNIGLAKIALGRVAEGRRDVEAAIALDVKQGAVAYASDGWKELATYLERAGDLAGAVTAQREHRAMMDRVLRDETRKLLLEAQERQDAEQRARDIELLNRDNALKSEQVHQRNLALALWAALGGCVAVSLGLLWQAFRRVRRTNEALAHSNASLKRQSETDPLTGLANRRHFQAAVKSLSGPEGLSGSVFLIDVDHFKRINDSFGHAAGDAVLVEIARRLREAVRDDDLVVRWGGEEFLIIARTREALFAPQLAQRLLDLIGSRPVSHEGRDIPVTASIGFVSLPLPPHGLRLTWERAIDLVDTVMYLAKAHGRNKAYGVERLQAKDALAAAQLTARLEAAVSEGSVGLLALSGPAGVMPPSVSGFSTLEPGPGPAAS
ncbi:GGDEF domain-containing protein [Roseateles asaccharophilus]|uniref:diguanylate cyclase n=1 Tax=Roseateles asaccharophilus TaxID=582607 RepID=A0ABU2A7T5_9BURK|nr:GGDEF domain-containing protein [Roseateles asaccharophilus]MDR7333257.1 diguanylate cyclase (GGDEF)-like protein [Roseateles asaccharophilus]